MKNSRLRDAKTRCKETQTPNPKFKQIRAKIEIYVVFELKLDDQSYKEGYIILCHVKLWVMSA